MKAPENTSKPKALCPRGPQLCRCVQVVDLGTQHFQTGDDGSRKIYFGFETLNAKHTFKDDKGPEPFMLQVEFAWYMNSAKPTPTKLRTFIDKWRGKPLTDSEAKDYDFAKLIGMAAIITVAHTPKKDGSMKATIADIYYPEKPDAARVKAERAHNPLVCYEVANGEDGAFRNLPPFLQTKIKESDEFKKRGAMPDEDEDEVPMNHDEPPAELPPPAEHEMEGQDIPF